MLIKTVQGQVEENDKCQDNASAIEDSVAVSLFVLFGNTVRRASSSIVAIVDSPTHPPAHAIKSLSFQFQFTQFALS